MLSRLGPGTILLVIQERILPWDLGHLVDACSHSKNQRYKNLSPVRDNIDNNNNNNNKKQQQQQQQQQK